VIHFNQEMSADTMSQMESVVKRGEFLFCTQVLPGSNPPHPWCQMTFRLCLN
jgi:hypothetical protein